MSTQIEAQEEFETKEETKDEREQLELLSVNELQNKFCTFSVHNDTDKNCWEYKHESGTCEDILISNEFCQIAIGDNLIDDKEDNELLLESETYNMPDEDVSYMNKIITTGSPQLIAFDPQCNNFSITAEIFCDRDWGSRVFSNRVKNAGFEFVVPRYKCKLLSIYCIGGHINVGKTKLELKQWYHVAVTIERKIDKNKTIAKVFLNGHMDGEYDFPGGASLSTNGKGLIGSIGSDINGNDSNHIFEGKIKNVKIWYTCLSEHQLSQLSEGYEYKSDTTECKMEESMTFGYIPSSIQVEVPVADFIYNGPMTKLSHNLQPATGNFTITAMIIPTRAYGSRVISSRYNSNGFEMVVPRYGSNVFSVWTRDGHVDIGETKLDIKKKMYHVACTVNRISGSGAERTVISGYVNGKKDGGHVFYNLRNLNGGETWIGSRQGKDDKFDGSINNLRIYYKCLSAAEIATIYASDIRDCNASFNNNPNDYQYYINNLKKWIPIYKYNGIDFENAQANITLLTNTKKDEKQDLDIDVSLIKKTNLLTFIPGSDALKINNIGGTIVGIDFNNNNWKLITPKNGNIAKHLMFNNSLKLLIELKPFPKYDFMRVLTKYNNGIGTKYLLNRLIVCASMLLENVHNDSKKWDYLNQYILPWEIWSQNNEFGNKLKEILLTNFNRLQSVARQLQKPYKMQQFELFDKLQSNSDVINKIFSIKSETNSKYAICRQDSFSGGMICECPKESKDSNEYDESVCSKLLWGRCMILNEEFQNDISNIYKNDKRFVFQSGPVKTYERMVEKVIEYTNEGAKFPRAFKICDVLRCSINCQTLNDIFDAFKLLEKCFEIVRIKNRFSKDFDANITDGYRDMLINILYQHKEYKLKVICEIQFHLHEFLQIKKKQHKLYKIMRATSYKTLLRNYEARKFDK